MADTNKDIDFDELHQAVNALMDQTQKDKKPADTTQESRPTEPVAERSKPQPKAEPEHDRISVTVKRPLPLLTTHRASRGRAMDVISPRPKTPVAPPSERPKREAPTLRPARSVEPEESKPVAHTTPPPLADSATAPAKEPGDDVLASLNLKDEPVAEHHTMTHQKIDLSEAHGAKNDDTTAKAEEPKEHTHTDKAEPEAPAPESDKHANTHLAEQDEESATPFVTTKVEKRPLGAYAGTEQAAEPEAPKPAEESKGDKHEDKDAPSPLPAQPQPEELSPEVVAVESASPEPLTTAEDAEEAPGVDGLRNMAIPHQYHESDKAADDHARPVFDTKEYHPAIEAHVGGHHKQSPVGGWIIGISLTALVLVALGFIYYMIYGSLDFSLLFS